MKDKEQTKRKLINAVAHVIRNEGHSGLGVNKIARLAGTDKKLIYRYFGSFERLLEAYVMETDYWMRFADHLHELKVPEGMEDVKSLLGDILKNQFLYFYEHKEMQQLILWELTVSSNLMRSVHRAREAKGQELLQMADQYLKNDQLNFRAVAALLVGGIYYMILHTRHNGAVFSDIDLSEPNGRQHIINAIETILTMVFEG
ncbi:TetR/AcrR family transcriptional regulator [Mucilaginibacter sp. 21P]|uniref:TetR/AcrR family transcriptional regulator n=1 Tax=Mucilaginibacter sp. 21P TaxID=2778902 RepID=UPI001C5596F2|nr:TetR/AcrR family transcriptional regulator [Mucilaginibacter sp. 21P]QXV63958.1 TetR/AcrR family transcriptional regulator [Mucilaginibacter sp. 21P]